MGEDTWGIVLTLVLLNPDPTFANSVNPSQLAYEAQKPADLDQHCLPLRMQMYIHKLD